MTNISSSICNSHVTSSHAIFATYTSFFFWWSADRFLVFYCHLLKQRVEHIQTQLQAR